MNKRRVLIILAAIAAMLIAVPVAHAAAGGGSGGFSGGGGGGGGRGAGLYILIQILIRIAIFGHGLGALVLVGIILAAVLFGTVAPKVSAFWSASKSRGPASRRRTAQRQRRVELAAAEAAEEDEAFAPGRVRTEARGLFDAIQAAWDAGDRRRLGELVAPSLLAEWNRRLDDFERRGWRNRTQPIGEPRIEYVGLSNPGGQKRVVVRIEARVRDYVEDRAGRHIKRVGRMSEIVFTREYWRLEQRNGRWILNSIEQGAEGAHALEEKVVATPWSDDEALRDLALTEQAAADALPHSVKPSEVADLDFSGDAKAAALDLSLADGRFSPDVLEVAARRAVAAWAEAVDGGDERLRGLASPAAAQHLLYPAGPNSRLVIRGPRVNQITITGLDAASDPPTMTIRVDLSGRRYLEDRATTTVLSGDPSRTTRFRESWKLALTDDPGQPWRIVESGLPAVA